MVCGGVDMVFGVKIVFGDILVLLNLIIVKLKVEGCYVEDIY